MNLHRAFFGSLAAALVEDDCPQAVVALSTSGFKWTYTTIVRTAAPWTLTDQGARL